MKFRKMKLCLFLLTALALSSCAQDGHSPEITIGENGNWFIDGEDQGVPAQGEKGDQGDKGDTGISVKSITKTKTEGNVDTYTITFSNNTTSTFTVTNGVDGDDADALTVTNVSIKSSANNVDTYEISFSDGYTTTFTVTNGKNGENLSVISINKESTDGKYDTYKISFSDDSYQTFIVKNGEDGLTPYIGDNGNWWIGDEDTGVLADYDKANNVPLTIYSSGLKYETRTINGISGYVVTGWSALDDEYLIVTYGQELADSFNDLTDKTLVIPNYVGSVPVIGVMANSNLNFGKIVLSKNTIYLDQAAFKNHSNLKEIDFNGCKINEIPMECFYGTSLEKIDIPETVSYIFDKAFDGVALNTIDLKNVKYIGNQAFDDAFIDYVYLTDNLEYVGNNVFDGKFVYVEAETKPSNWGTISSSSYGIKYNVKKNEEYLYSIESNEATIYQYLGNEKKLVIPATIDNIPITTIGCGFNSHLIQTNELSGMSEEECYEYLTNIQGFPKEIIIPSNIKKVEQYALLNGNTDLYFSSGLKTIYIGGSNNDVMMGFFGGAVDDDSVPYALIAFEDISNNIFVYGDNSYNYEQLVEYGDWFGVIFKQDVKYEDIYYDEDNLIYYKKSGNSYSVISSKARYITDRAITILDDIDGIKVETIEKASFVCCNIKTFVIVGNNVTRIRSYAFAECEMNIFIPNNVAIINAYGLDLYNNSIIYVEVFEKPEDWDTKWNSNARTVVYSANKSDYENLVFYENMIGRIKDDNTIELIKYTGEYANTTIKIPRTIDGKVVSSISTGFFVTNSSYNNMNIYIPSSVTVIESKAIDIWQSYYYLYIYLESSSIPSAYETNWYYNSYSNNTSYIGVHTGETFDY